MLGRARGHSGPTSTTSMVALGLAGLGLACVGLALGCGARSACGDGSLDADEECDDGNIMFGDGCDETCHSEALLPLLAEPDPAGDADTVPFDLANLSVGWTASDHRLTLIATAHDKVPLANFGIAFLFASSVTSCLNAVISAHWDQVQPLSAWRHCGNGWEDAALPPSLETNAPDPTDWVAIRVDPSEIDSAAVSFVFVAVQSFDETAYDAFPDDGTMVALVWSNADCGNGRIEPGEDCDDGNRTSGDGCSQTCVIEETCGDTVLDDGEQCDDGNLISGDGCDSICQLESVCGDGMRQANEECDDGNRMFGDGCSPSCQLETDCGNEEVEAGETCDDGNRVSGDGCSAACQLEPACGNGHLDPGELCDDGFHDLCGSCNGTCSGPGFGSVCGDGIVCPERETCDDGNTSDGDACPADCAPPG